MNKSPSSSNITRFFRIRTLFLITAVLFFLSSASAQAQLLSNLWSILPGDRPYVTTANNERGVAFNPATGKVLMVGRQGGVNVYVLDALTGDDGDTGGGPRVLDTSIVSGGTFALSMIGVGDDGVVYGANLSTSTTVPNFKIYRWEDDDPTAVPTIAFEGDPAGTNELTGLSNNVQRWGDSLDVRGSGTNAMIVAASRNTTVVAVFTTEDGLTFRSTIITNAASAAGSSGVAFGAANTLWLKLNGQPLRHVAFDLATGQSTFLHSFANPQFPNGVSPIAVNVASNWLGAIAFETPDNFRLYDISDLTIPPAQLDRKDLVDNANLNGVGSADFGSVGDTNLVFALDTNNGLLAYRIVPPPLSAPVITVQPVNQTVLVGAAAASFNVTVTGSTPLSYQWRFNDADIAGATKSSLSITNPQVSNAGNYSVAITNTIGSAISSNAVLTVELLVQSDALTELWRIAPGDRPYVNTDGTQRGIAFNPATTNVLLVSRTGGTNVYVLDGNTGAEKHRLTVHVDPPVISGGTFALSMIGAADDGVVYAANLTTDSGTVQLAVYRWENDSSNAIPTVAYLGDPRNGNADPINRRFGDSFAVRGSGVNTQVLLGSRDGTVAAVLTTLDGLSFTATTINSDATAGDFGLGVTFGAGNSFWGKTIGRPLRLIDFDLAAGTGTTRFSFPANLFRSEVSPIGVNSASNWLAAVAIEIPDNLRLYDISSLANLPVLIDQRLFPADNENVNGTGSVSFIRDRLYAVDSNSGVLAYTVKAPTTQLGPIAASLNGSNVILTWPGPGTLQSSTNVAGVYSTLGGATSPYTNSITDDSQRFFRLSN